MQTRRFGAHAALALAVSFGGCLSARAAAPELVLAELFPPVQRSVGLLAFAPASAEGRPLATTPPPSRRAFNAEAAAVGPGRVWVGRGVTAQNVFTPERVWRRGGPARYGAAAGEPGLVFANVNGVAVGLRAWEPLGREGDQTLERARQAWLRERGFVGSVRTFTRPAAGAASDRTVTRPAPRAIFRTPPEAPRFRSRDEI